jgi:hypothetical protein
MKKIVLFFSFILLTTFVYSQKDLVLTGKNNQALQKLLDSALISNYFITADDADKILEKPSHLKDSTYKFSNGILRYSFDYVANYIDSTSKGRLFFSFEQYNDVEISKSTYQSIKNENEKTGTVIPLSDLSDEAFLQKDYLGQPFIIIRKANKIFKLKVYYLSSKTSLDELVKTTKKAVAAH